MKNCRFRQACILAGLFMFLVMPLAAAAQTPQKKMLPHKIIRLNNRPASSVADLARIYLSKEGRLVIDERLNAVIVVDYQENLDKIEQLIRSADVRQPMVRIHIKTLGFTRGSTTSVFGSAARTSSGWVIGVQPVISSTGSTADTNMFLTTMSGSDAFILVGERVPYETWFYDYSFSHGYVARGVVFQDVTTGFYVTPYVRGDTIEVRIAPGISYYDGTNRNKIIFREMETSVVLRDGQTTVIGAGESQNAQHAGLISHITGTLNSRVEDRFTFQLTVRLVRGE